MLHQHRHQKGMTLLSPSQRLSYLPFALLCNLFACLFALSFQLETEAELGKYLHSSSKSVQRPPDPFFLEHGTVFAFKV